MENHTSRFSLSLKEFWKSTRDMVIEWSIALLPLIADFGLETLQMTEEFLTNYQLAGWTLAFKLLAPYAKRYFNLWRVK